MGVLLATDMGALGLCVVPAPEAASQRVTCWGKLRRTFDLCSSASFPPPHPRGVCIRAARLWGGMQTQRVPTWPRT